MDEAGDVEGKLSAARLKGAVERDATENHEIDVRRSMTYPWRQLYLLVCGELASKLAIEWAARIKSLLLDSGRTKAV